MKNKFYLGLLYGAALPLLAYVFGDMLQDAFKAHLSRNFFHIICIGINVIIFRFAIKKEYDNLARGVLFTTFIYALIFAWFFLYK